MSLALLLYIIALVLLMLAAANVNPPRVNLGWAGLALWLFTAAILPTI